MVEEENDSQLSALRENISRKGTNSYYYAHGSKIDGPAWDGREEPRLLSSTVSESSSIKKVMITALDNFSWLDETKNVKVYVDFDNAGSVEESNVNLTNTSNSVDFKFDYNGKTYSLLLNPLNESIQSVSYKKKNDKFVLTLKKTEEKDWSSLKKT